MAAMKSLQLSYIPNISDKDLIFFTKSYVFCIKEYNKAH